MSAISQLNAKPDDTEQHNQQIMYLSKEATQANMLCVEYCQSLLKVCNVYQLNAVG